MIFFPYTRFLEKQLDRLEEKNAQLEQRNQELVLAILEKTKISVTSQFAPSETSTEKHKIQKSETSASCSCGWNYYSSDPAELQQNISSHYRKISLPGGRKGWGQMKSILESGSENANQ